MGLRMKNFSSAAFLLSVILLQITLAQQTTNQDYQYISPVPGSSLNQPETNIIIRYGAAYNLSNTNGEQILEVKGSRSGLHTGKIKITENNQTILFIPDFHFTEGETVTVKLISPVITIDGEQLPELNFNFRITKKNLNNSIRANQENHLLEYISSELHSVPGKNAFLQPVTEVNDTLPEDFPPITVNVNTTPAPGMIFFSPFIYPGFNATYLIITDNFGTPVFYRKMNSANFDFKKQPTGVLSYYEKDKFYVLDASYNLIDSLYMKNGYLTDAHELIILENNHALMICYDAQEVAMDTVVPGGDPNATVIGLVIQELDENKDVVFQWRSWDHFKITDATYDIDLTAPVIDYVHGNAIEVDYDGNLLISSRHLDEITKISRQTGNLIWRLGGEHCNNNQFTFINDPLTGFSHQHDIRRISNGNITLFDNGNLHNPPVSRGIEYQLDEVNKYAQLISDYRNNPVTLSWAMGSSRRLDNHNTIIGWGTGLDPAITEIKIDGSLVLSFSLPDTMPNYRAFKFPWKTNLFSVNPEYVYFGYVPPGTSQEKQLEIVNNSNQTIQINNSYNRLSAYSVTTVLPISISPFGSAIITIKFEPGIEGDYFDDLHLRWQKESERIAQVIPLIGSTDPNFTSVDDDNEVLDYYLSQNYPNPFNPSTNIRFRIPDFGFVTLKVFDILGNEVAVLVNEEKPAGSYEVEFDGIGLSSGIYLFTLRAGSFIQTKKMVLMR
jgi:hypothetical protein